MEKWALLGGGDVEFALVTCINLNQLPFVINDYN